MGIHRAATQRSRVVVSVIFAAILLVACSALSAAQSDVTTARVSTSTTLQPTPIPVADDGAKVIAQTNVGPREVDLTVFSPALARNVMVRLLLPPDWTTKPTAQWPVLYLLHGCCDSYVSWTRSTDVVSLTANTDVLVVMPDAGTAGYYSNWLSGTPAWETFHLTELRQILERGYRAGTQRAIAGLSMGGFGALSYAARNPGMFKAAASYSGAVDTTYSADAINMILNIVSGSGFARTALWGDPTADAKVWAAHNPTDLASQLRGVQLFVSSGNGQPGPLDPPNTGFDGSEAVVGQEAGALLSHLRQLGIPVVADMYGPGTHSWSYWQRELHESFPIMMRAIGAVSR